VQELGRPVATDHHDAEALVVLDLLRELIGGHKASEGFLVGGHAGSHHARYGLLSLINESGRKCDNGNGRESDNAT